MSIKVVTIKQLAEMLGIHERTILIMEKNGDIPPRINISLKRRAWEYSTIANWLSGKSEKTNREYEKNQSKKH